ncbi:trichohyalin [Biomphalaria glabrata]
MNHKTLLFTSLLLLALKLSVQKDVCLFPAPMIPVYSNISLNATAEVNDAALAGSNTILENKISYMGMTITNGTYDINIEIKFNVMLYDTSSVPERVNISLSLKNLAACDMSFASLEIDLLDKMDAFWDAGVPANSVMVERSRVIYNTSFLAVNESVSIHFLAVPSGKGGIDLPEETNTFYAYVSFTVENTTYGKITPSICLLGVADIKENIIYQHGFTALTFFIMLFVGIGLAILAIWLFFCIRKKRRDASVSPTKNNEKRKGKKIVTDAKTAMYSHSIKNISAIGLDESIVYVLGMKDKLQMYREIDNLDILSTIHVDTDIEEEQNDASVQASLLLVHGLRHNGDIKKNIQEKATNNLQNNLKELNKKLDTEFKKELEEIYVEIELKNKEALGELTRKHKEKKEDMLVLMKNLSESEQKQTLELFDKQVQIEENELTYKLALEQNEDVEQLRKEYSVRKRIGIKEIQQQFINDVIKDGDMTSTKAEWLLKQHRQQQDEIAHKFDDEISRQRMILEEKLAKRRTLAHASEVQEDDQKEILNEIASCQVNLVQTIKLAKSLTDEQMESQIEQLKGDLKNVKDEMDKKSELNQQELFKKLTQLKRKALTEKMSQQKLQLQDYMAKNKATETDPPVDPISYVTGLVNLKSQHRQELSDLENQLDEEHARELAIEREKLSELAKEKLKSIEKHLIEKLKAQGVLDDTIERILRKHEKTVKEIEAKQITDRKNQETKMKAELAKRKKEFAEMRAREKQEQNDLRRYETEIVDKLLDSQFAISEEDRDRILKEHEKQLVKLENSLTLNKLRQKRILEEKIALRRAQQMEELQQKQEAEIVKHRRIAESNGEEEDEETLLKELKLKKKHAEQQMALIQGLDFNFEKELDEIRTEMVKERALMLKSQEEKMGAFIATLQMNKAREMAKIEEQQKAINNLKANLLDDLNSRGILSTPECERIILRHKQEQEELNEKLDKERLKQEKVLRSKLQERLQQREELLVKKQEEEIKMLLEQSSNKYAAKIKRALIIHKNLVEMEKFKNKLQREINQTLEDRKRDFNLQQQKMIQEEELKFLAGLVTIGSFEQHELLNVLRMLFPLRTEEAIIEMLNKIYKEDAKSSTKKGNDTKSTLVQRILKTHYSLMTAFPKSGASSHSAKNNSFNASAKKDYADLVQGDRIKHKNNFGPQDYAEKAARLMQTSPQEWTRSGSAKYQNPTPYNNKAFTKNIYSESDDSDSIQSNFSGRNNYTNSNQSKTKLDSKSRNYEHEYEEYAKTKAKKGTHFQEIGIIDNLSSSTDVRAKKKKKTFLKSLTKQNNYSSD